MRVILYTRVSSEKQIENTSLSQQLEHGKKYCESRGLTLMKVFEERGESAKTTDRPKLLEAMNYCSKKSNKIEAFLVYKYDRFSRNVADYQKLRAWLSTYNVKLISMTEQTDDDPSGRLMENIITAFAQFDNELRKERCTNGMKARIKQGYWPFDTPLGYTKENKIVIKDDTRWDIVQTGFNMMLKGCYRQNDIAEFWNDVGLKTRAGKHIKKDLVSRTFRNPFYAGIVEVKKWKLYYEGNHPAMITLNQYELMQDILNEKRTTQCMPHNQMNEDFPLNQILVCGNCNHSLSGSTAKGKYKYYACRQPNCSDRERGSADDIHDKFENLLKKLHIKEDLKNEFINRFVKKIKIAEKEISLVNKTIRNKVRTIEDKIENLYTLVEDGTYSKETYDERKRKFEAELIALEAGFVDKKIDHSKVELYVNLSTNFINDLPRTWKHMTVIQQRRLMEIIFKDKIVLKNGELRTPKTQLLSYYLEEVEEKVASGRPRLEILELIISAYYHFKKLYNFTQNLNIVL